MKRFTDAGLEVPDVIGFAEWVVEDPERRREGLEQARREMAMVAELSGRQMAAPLVGAAGGTSKRDDPNFTQPVGVGPVRETFARLGAMNYTGFVSLELFNREYWRQDPHRVAATGLAKLKAAAGA